MNLRNLKVLLYQMFVFGASRKWANVVRTSQDL